MAVKTVNGRPVAVRGTPSGPSVPPPSKNPVPPPGKQGGGERPLELPPDGKGVDQPSQAPTKRPVGRPKGSGKPKPPPAPRKPPVPPPPKPVASHEEKFGEDASQKALFRNQERKNYNRTQQMHEQTTIRDIAFLPELTNFQPLRLKDINWERRLACKADPILDLRTYMPKIFYLGFADFHYSLINDIEDRIDTGGRKAIAFPRGGGKTAICRGMILRATKYGKKRFCFFIGAKEDKAEQTLNFLKIFWHRSPELQQDFPEIAYPIHRLEGRSTGGTSGQIYKGQRTYIGWAANELTYPTMMFTEEDVAGYLQHDPSCVTYLPQWNKFVINNAGIMVRVSGIDGSIRGEADTHPILMSQPRPDMVLLDDVQKDQTAHSPASCLAMERLIESAVDNLAAPDVPQTCLMPCTVIVEGDVSDTYLTPDKKPEWSGERYGLTKRFPPGIDYEHIYEEIDGKPNYQGKLWIEYNEHRIKSYRLHGDLRLANEFYRTHQAELEKDFEVSWKERFKRNDPPNPLKDEISAIQSLMNLRFKDHISYLSEQENRPRGALAASVTTVTKQEVQERMTKIPEGQVSLQWTNLVCFIDVQDEILFYAVLAHDLDFNGQFIDYGTYPKISVPYFRKSNLASWSFLTREFYKANPQVQDRPARLNSNRGTYHRAPFDAKIYSALQHCTKGLLDREYPRTDRTMMKIRAMAIDTKWGEASAIVKQFVRENNNERVMCYEGHSFAPSFKQLEEYNPAPGWMFEHQMHPHTQESRWCVKPYQKGEYNQKFIQADVNRWKTFLMKRLASPMGSPGSITLYFTEPCENHRMIADHITSELPEEVENRGITKAMWTPKPGYQGDNDYLDCAVGCLCLASICGASLKFSASGEVQKTTKRSIRKVYNQKKRA